MKVITATKIKNCNFVGIFVVILTISSGECILDIGVRDFWESIKLGDNFRHWFASLPQNHFGCKLFYAHSEKGFVNSCFGLVLIMDTCDGR